MNDLATPDREAVRYRVTGMDCAHCAAKVLTAARGVAGVRDAQVSIASQIMTLQLDDPQTATPEIERAVTALDITPRQALVDGNRLPRLDCPARAIVGGDASEPCISAASIIAKVSRDHEMVVLDRSYPGYGLAQHKGYPTKAHMAALQTLGVTSIHRRSFAPVRRLIDAEERL